MIKCPNCQATLPDDALTCQFCGTAMRAAPVQGSGRTSSKSYSNSGWERPTYYGIAAFWLVSGLWSVLNGLLLTKGGNYIGAAVGGLTALIGLGLLAKVEFVRGLVNIACFLQILSGILGVITTFFMGSLGGLGILLVLLDFLQIAFAVLMIYLIGETDTRGPNF